MCDGSDGVRIGCVDGRFGYILRVANSSAQ